MVGVSSWLETLINMAQSGGLSDTRVRSSASLLILLMRLYSTLV